jgi:flagellar hook assembly protein FlgD
MINQDGINFVCYAAQCACEDKEGNIWLGTDMGPVYLDKERIADNSLGVIQYKVPRNDGTNYADYLLANISINCIAVDGAGRKWFGTDENGAYLISDDNNTQVQHFTAENSKLLSNRIESIAINQTTGEVFFGTDKGLCSYVSDATETNTEMTTDNVWAYPNPVEPGYTGLITIVGLSYNADVKILSANGVLIAEGKSNGGSFTWDGCDKKGRRVASGIYMVATAKSNGEKGTVCKIAIVR